MSNRFTIRVSFLFALGVLGCSAAGEEPGTTQTPESSLQSGWKAESLQAASPGAQIVSTDPTEVRDTIQKLNLKVGSGQQPIGVMAVTVRFSATEISGCWTDESLATINIKLYESGKLIWGVSQNASLLHSMGHKCTTNSDAGPMVTDAGSVKCYALGYREVSGGITMMLEATDVTHWTLLSGGEVGSTSMLGMYFPQLLGDTVTGGLTGFSMTKEQIAELQHLTFKIDTSGTGARVKGHAAVLLELSGGKTTDTFRRKYRDVFNKELFPESEIDPQFQD